jgi:protein-S-isoprenylcysteine O-methyltransferase Ste14
MARPTTAKLDSAEQDPDTVVRVGGWLFKRRTSLPLPIVAALLFLPARPSTPSVTTLLTALGVLTIALGEAIRFWGVHHIGVISRTRSDRLGPLIDTGPFSLVRNPLYLGNILLWTGFALAAHIPWLAPVILALLAAEYHAIVRWEERLLEARLGEPYRVYQQRVPRWIPKLTGVTKLDSPGVFSWRETLFSERGTLIGIAAGFALLAIKNWIMAHS